jgi:hypothetical protein
MLFAFKNAPSDVSISQAKLMTNVTEGQEHRGTFMPGGNVRVSRIVESENDTEIQGLISRSDTKRIDENAVALILSRYE